MLAPDRRWPAFDMTEARWCVVVATVAAALYLRTVSFGWVYDDQMEVVLNTFVRSFSYLPQWFGTTVWTGSGMETFLYRPLALATYAANYAVAGYAPWTYHLVNVLLHAGASVLVVRVALLWGLRLPAAGLAGLIFAVHPVHVEVVAAVFGRKDLLATVFVLATLLSHRRGVARGGMRAVVPVVWYALALLSKEIGVVALPLVFLQDLRLEPDRRAFFDRPRVMVMYFGYMATLVAYLLLRTAVVGGLGIPDTSPLDNPLVSAPAIVRLATAAVVVAKGLGLLFVPVSLSPDYSFDAIPLVTSLADPRLLGPLALLALAALALAQPRYRPIAWAAAAYAIALLPVSNLVLLSGTIFAERLLYLPSVAFCVAVAWVLEANLRGRRWTAIPIVLTLLGGQAFLYSGAWTDDIALFTRAAQAQPRSTKAHHKLGEELLRAGRLGEALRSLDRALVVAPDNAYAMETQQTAWAMTAARYLPPPQGAGQAPPPDPDIWNALGVATLAQSDTASALNFFTEAVALDPLRSRTWFALATLHMAQGNVDQAADALRRFLTTDEGLIPQQVAWATEALARIERR